MFARGSRYEQVPDGVYQDPNGQQIPYKLMRVLPGDFVPMQIHTVADGDRLDLIAYRYYGDPLQFWRVCDANHALRPDDLLVIGRRLVIPIVQR